MSDQPPQQPPAPRGGPPYPAQPPQPGPWGQRGPGGPPGPQPPTDHWQPVDPMANVADPDPDVPLHPLLPAGGFASAPGSVQGGPAAHQLPHAASAGPQDGSRGAMWFAVLVAVIVVLALLGAFVFGIAGR